MLGYIVSCVVIIVDLQPRVSKYVRNYHHHHTVLKSRVGLDFVTILNRILRLNFFAHQNRVTPSPSPRVWSFDVRLGLLTSTLDSDFGLGLGL